MLAEGSVRFNSRRGHTRQEPGPPAMWGTSRQAQQKVVTSPTFDAGRQSVGMARSPSWFPRHDPLDSGQLLGGHRENRTTANDAVCCLAVRADLRPDYEHPLGSLTLPQFRHGWQFHFRQPHIAIEMEHCAPSRNIVRGRGVVQWTNVGNQERVRSRSTSSIARKLSSKVAGSEARNTSRAIRPSRVAAAIRPQGSVSSATAVL